MLILGISAFYHDSACVFIKDGKIIYAAQEERFSRVKSDSRFPRQALRAGLCYLGLELKDFDQICFHEKPFLTFERLLETYLAIAPKGFKSFCLTMPVWLREKLFIKQRLHKIFKEDFGHSIRGRLSFSSHHLSHAASAFYPSPFTEAAILTVDGVGEASTCTIGFGKGREIKTLKEMRFPHSWGLFYSAFTAFLGFKVNGGEYKMMGLAPYGDRDSADYQFFYKQIKSELVRVFADGSLQMNLKHFAFVDSERMIRTKNWEQIFQMEARVPESLLTQKQADLALAAQDVLEEGLLALAQLAAKLTGSRNLVMAGGVALNCVANGKILRAKIFDQLWIQPAADDAGGALGAAFVYDQYVGKTQLRKEPGRDLMQGSYLGPSFSDDEIRTLLRDHNLVFEECAEEGLLCERVATELQQNKVVGWFQGRMEWGPRALGHRSIIASPLLPEMQQKLNRQIKFRETFRPFAPIVATEDAPKYFEISQPSPYMLRTELVVSELRKSRPANYPELSLGDKLKAERSVLPAITHLDYSARVQTLEQNINPRFHRLLKTFGSKSGHPVLINTSFNVRGEPIVCSPQEALQCFLKTGMDVLVLERFVVRRGSDVSGWSK